MIRSSDAGPAVNQEKDQGGAFDCNLRLLEDADGNLGLFARNDPAGIDNFVGTPVPTYSSVDSVARDAGLVGNDRAPLANQPVE